MKESPPEVARRLTRPRTVAVKLVLAGLVAACLVHFGLSARGAVEAFFAAVLVVLSAIDIERHIIPNQIVLPATAIVLAAQIGFFPGDTVEWVVAAVAAAAFFLIMHLVYPAGLGMGDVKLALLLGAALGRYVAAGVLIGLLASAVFGVALIVNEGWAARKKAIPLGPFLAFGAVAALFLWTPG